MSIDAFHFWACGLVKRYRLDLNRNSHAKTQDQYPFAALCAEQHSNGLGFVKSFVTLWLMSSKTRDVIISACLLSALSCADCVMDIYVFASAAHFLSARHALGFLLILFFLLLETNGCFPLRGAYSCDQFSCVEWFCYLEKRSPMVFVIIDDLSEMKPVFEYYSVIKWMCYWMNSKY